MEPSLFPAMFRVEQTHWWFSGRLRILAEMVRRYAPKTGKHPLKLIEPGCGTGSNLDYFRKRGFLVAGFDASEVAVEYSRRRGLDVRMATFDAPVFDAGSFDVVLMPDVIEHIEDDRLCAKVAYDLLRPGGTLILTTPADPGMWSRHDEIHHHVRRYRRAQLIEVLAGAGFQLQFVSHCNTLLYPIAWLMRKVWQPMFGQSHAATEQAAEQVLRIPPKPVNFVLRWIFASERWLLGRVELPVGLSLIAVAFKPGGEADVREPLTAHFRPASLDSQP